MIGGDVMSEEEEIETGTPTAASSSGLIYVFLLRTLPAPPPIPAFRLRNPLTQPARQSSLGYLGTEVRREVIRRV